MFDQMDSPSLQKAQPEEESSSEDGKAKSPKSWFLDPYLMLDHLGLGYRASPSNVSYETLRNMAEKEPIIASIINTRVHQVESFCQPQPNKYSIGFKIEHRFNKDHVTSEDKKAIQHFQSLIMNSGRKYNRTRDDLLTVAKKITRDSLIYDQVNIETVRNMYGNVIEYFPVSARTIRMSAPKSRKGTPPRSQREAEQAVRYAQLIDGTIATEYTEAEMVFAVRNPRTDLDISGYGFSEIEMLIRVITALLWGVDWNIKSFSQGATTKGILNLKGHIPPQHFEAFKRQWIMQTAGVQNAWKTPLVNTDGIEWMPLQLSNNEMGYQQWLEFLVKVASAVYLIDPAEINFDVRGSSQQAPMFMGGNEAQQKVSKDRGLRPLLNFISGIFNKYVIWPEDDKYEFRFVGLDAKTEEQAVELRLKGVQYKTLNEVRREDDLPPVKEGDVVLNPTYTGYLAQKVQQSQQAAMGGAPGGGPPQGGGVPGQPGKPGMPQPGQPGAMPGQPTEAFASKFEGKPYEHEEHQTGRKIENEAQSPDDSTVTGKKSSSDSEDESHTEDWETSVHASLDTALDDLQKHISKPSLKKRLKKSSRIKRKPSDFDVLE